MHALLKEHIWSGHPTCPDRSEAQAVKWVDHLDNKQRTWDLDLLIPIPDSALLATRATPLSTCCRIDKCSVLITFPLWLDSLCPPILPQYWGQRPLAVGQISWFKLERKTRAGLLAPGGQGVAWVLPLSSGSRSEVADLVRVWGGVVTAFLSSPKPFQIWVQVPHTHGAKHQTDWNDYERVLQIAEKRREVKGKG